MNSIPPLNTIPNLELDTEDDDDITGEKDNIEEDELEGE